MWRQSLPWHKVLNAVVAEISIHKLKDLPQRSLDRTDERLGTKLRVTENRCVLFNPSTYVINLLCITIFCNQFKCELINIIVVVVTRCQNNKNNEQFLFLESCYLHCSVITPLSQLYFVFVFSIYPGVFWFLLCCENL